MAICFKMYCYSINASKEYQIFIVYNRNFIKRLDWAFRMIEEYCIPILQSRLKRVCYRNIIIL